MDARKIRKEIHIFALFFLPVSEARNLRDEVVSLHLEQEVDSYHQPFCVAGLTFSRQLARRMRNNEQYA